MASGKAIGFLVAVVGLALVAIALIAAAFGTKYWITQTVQYTQINITDSGDTSTTAPSYLNVNLIRIHMGLFQGNCDTQLGAFTPPPDTFYVKDFKDQDGFMNFGLWVCTIMFLALGILFGLITIVFSVVNSFMTPIEEITGIKGIYLWNNLAGFFTLLGMLMFVGEFYSSWQNIVLNLNGSSFYSLNDLPTDQLATLNYSFYLVLVSTVLFELNNAFIYLSTFKAPEHKKQLPASMDHEAGADGDIMLY